MLGSIDIIKNYEYVQLNPLEPLPLVTGLGWKSDQGLTALLSNLSRPYARLQKWERAMGRRGGGDWLCLSCNWYACEELPGVFAKSKCMFISKLCWYRYCFHVCLFVFFLNNLSHKAWLKLQGFPLKQAIAVPPSNNLFICAFVCKNSLKSCLYVHKIMCQNLWFCIEKCKYFISKYANESQNYAD